MLAAEMKLPLEQVRAYWAMRQGLAGGSRGGAADAVRNSGWLYSSGSTLPYLAIRARLRKSNRATLDGAVFDEQQLVEVFAVRGCTMLVPSEDVPVALAAAKPYFSRHVEKVRTACAIRDREIKDLSTAIPVLLRDGPLPIEKLLEALPRNLVRNLGEPGRKFGERSTLSLTLRQLQADGVVQRIAIDRRLDSAGHAYQLFRPQIAGQIPGGDAAEQLARRFFRWAAPATLKEFAWWAGLSQRDARKAIDRLCPPLANARGSVLASPAEPRPSGSGVGITYSHDPLVKVAAEDSTEEAWIPQDQLDELCATHTRAQSPRFNFLPARDNFLYFRRGLGVFLDPADRSTEVLDWNNRPALLADLDSLHHNAIVEQGKLVGYWEFDPESQQVVWSTCHRLNAGAKKELETGISDLQRFIREQLGDVAMYPFDGGKNRRHRIDSLT